MADTRSEQDKDRAKAATHDINADLTPDTGRDSGATPAETKAAVKAARSDEDAAVATVADPALASEHQRAHDEGWEQEFHRREEMARWHPNEPELEPEMPDEGKLAETRPLGNAPTADELRAMGREVKPLIEPTDVPSDVYPHKVELYSAEERDRIARTGQCPTCGQRMPKHRMPLGAR